MTDTLYHIAALADWESAGASYQGGPLDRQDGFIHLSTAEQVPGTLERFFVGREDAVLLAIEVRIIAPDLRWEPAADGAGTFPHLYAALPTSAVRAAYPLTPDANGVPRPPADVLADEPPDDRPAHHTPGGEG